MSHCSEVHVSDNIEHKHENDPQYEKPGNGFRWSKEATIEITEGIKNMLRPMVILRNLRNKNIFDGKPEPDMQQLYNKIQHIKTKLQKSENILTSHDLRTKLAEHLDVPESEIDSYIPYQNIQDEDDSEDTRFMAVFATKKTLDRLKFDKTFHVDATYRLTWQRWPLLVAGVTSATGKFFGSMAVVSSHEDTEAWKELFNFVHSLGAHFQFRMADGAKEITKAGVQVSYILLGKMEY